MSLSFVVSGLIIAYTLLFEGINDKVSKVVNFTNIESLRCFSPDLLAELLSRYPEGMETRDIELPWNPVVDAFPFEKIQELLLCDDDLSEQSAPVREAIHQADHLASPEGRESILRLAEQQNISIPFEVAATNHDLALWTWLHHPCLLESVARRVKMHDSDSYFHYGPLNGPVASMSCSRDAIQKFQQSLRSHYKEILKGSFVQMQEVWRDDELWIVIRHGGHLKRRAIINDKTNTMESICFRGVESDIIIYNRTHGDLKIRYTDDKTLRVLREGFGRFFLGHSNCLSADEIFDLDRFKQRGYSFMASTIVPGIVSVVLEKVCYMLPGGSVRTIHEKPPKPLLGLHGCFPVVPPNTFLIDSVHLGFKFVDSHRYLPVRLSSPNKSTYAREADAWLVEQWLCKAGLMKSTTPAEGAAVA